MSGVFDDAYARYYDLFYGNKDYGGEAAYVLEVASNHLQRTAPSTGIRILELGCGTGRHAERFLASGCTVCGVDRSPEMVATAAERLRGNPAARFMVGDATNLDVGEKFDLVVALFHVLSYQTEDKTVRAFLRTAAAHLEPGGVAVFDFWHGPGVLSDPPATRVRRLSSGELNVVRIAEPTVDASRNLVEVNYTLYFNQQGEETWRRADELHRMRYFFLPELSELQESSGLTPVCYLPWMAREGIPDRTNWYATVIGRKDVRASNKRG